MVFVGLAVALVAGTAIGWIAHASRPSAPPVKNASTSHESDPTAPDEVTSALRQTVDQVGAAVAIFDADGREIYRNSAALAMVGTHAGVIVDGHLDEIVALAVADRPTERAVELHGPPRQDLVVRAERLSGGGTVAIIEDVSERKRIDAMRTDFVANISHELKTPVGAIAVLAETLEGERDIDAVERMSERIVDEAHRAVGTIDDLLELSRIEVAGEGTEVIDLSAAIESAMSRGRAADTSIDVEAIGVIESIHLRADRLQIVSALGNLVENAVKYSERGDAVQVQTQIDDRYIEIMVIDHGVGIPQRDLHRVFERFYRVDRSRRRETGGTGLGLAIVRHVATNHGGDVTVSSEEGEGSTFVFRLPTSLVVEVGSQSGDDDRAAMKEDA